MNDETVAGQIAPADLPDRPFLQVIRGDFRYEGPVKRDACTHDKGFWLDDEAGEVLCQACEQPLSLMTFAHVMMAWHDRLQRFHDRVRRERVEAIREQLTALQHRRALSADDRARIERARWAAHVMPIDELVALRDAMRAKAKTR